MGQIFKANVWQEGHWYIAQALSVEVASQGTSEEQALSNLREALELYLEPIPSTCDEIPVMPQDADENACPEYKEGSPQSAPQTRHVEVEIATT